MLSKSIIQKVLDAATSTGGDFAEIFVENKVTSNLVLVSEKVESSNSGIDFGVGIRIFSGFNCIYAYTNDVTQENLIKTALKAAKAIKKSDYIDDIVVMQGKMTIKHPVQVDPTSILKSKKVELLRRGYYVAKESYDSIEQVKSFLLDSKQNVLIANTEGLFVEDERSLVRAGIQCVATRNGNTETGGADMGGHIGYEIFDQQNIDDIARKAATTADIMTTAKLCPSGKFPVIIDNAFGGVIFHEACGHGLEATSVAKNKSIFANKVGQKIASSLVTAVDDGTLVNGWGSSSIDDEGNPMQRNVLIENGILKGYMIDKLNGRRMKQAPTGSSRRQSYKYAPTSRMTNTFILNGNSNLDDMIASTEYGLYAKKLGGGSVNTTTGDFNFAVVEGYIVKNGVITTPVKGATLIGNGGSVLHDIDMVGNNLELARGMCGSVSGTIPAALGQPALRVKEITVGGRSE